MESPNKQSMRVTIKQRCGDSHGEPADAFCGLVCFRASPQSDRGAGEGKPRRRAMCRGKRPKDQTVKLPRAVEAGRWWRERKMPTDAAQTEDGDERPEADGALGGPAALFEEARR